MKPLIEMIEGYELVSDHVSALPTGGKIVVQIIRAADKGYMVVHGYSDDSDPDVVPELRKACGYCDGVEVGCVSCPGNNPTLNCVTGTISCGDNN